MKRNTRTILAGGLLAVGTFAFAEAGQLEAGEAAYFKHDYANAMRLLRPLADSGNAPAQNRVASIYFWGALACIRMLLRRPYGIARPQSEGTPWRRLTLA
jgi:TPR repeat protein